MIIWDLRKQSIPWTDECLPYFRGRSCSTELLITESLYNKGFDSPSVQTAFVSKANDRLNKEGEEEYMEKEIKPRGSKKIIAAES